MNTKNLLCAIISLVLLWSCGKDDSPEPPKNNAPKIEAQSFTVAEDISDAVTIGTVKATDADQDKLTFSISTNDNSLFEISNSGVLSLSSGKSLNFSSKAQHQIVVSVTDGKDSANGNITIKVTEVTAVNLSPQLEDQSFEASEDIADTEAIGTVEASDAEGDTLSYSITENDGEFFEIDENTGELSLVAGQNLDFELFEEHTITISVTDGTNISEATITIIVGNIVDSLSEDSTSFVTIWKTEVAEEEIIVGTNDELDLTYDYTIDWGDGTIEDLTEGNPSHIYSNPGTYTVAINGQFPSIRIDKNLFDFEPVTTLISIEQWGAIQWENLESAFHNCFKMQYNATDAPNLTQITSLWNMFRQVETFSGGNLNNWDVSNITNMQAVFLGAYSDNLDVSEWDVSNVLFMGGMFESAYQFNSDISGWDVSSVTDMGLMFNGVTAFNQDLSGWSIQNVTNMDQVFNYSGMSPENLSATLIGWANNPNTALGVVCGIEGLTMCDSNEAIDAYAKLTTELEWQFSSYPDLVNCQ